MSKDQHIKDFLAAYPTDVQNLALAAGRLLRGALPAIAETVDESAKLIGYSYGPGYKGLLCTLILSQTGVKLGIVRGAELSDPKRLLTGTGKVHRFVQLRCTKDLRLPGLNRLIKDALVAWQKRSRQFDRSNGGPPLIAHQCRRH